MTKMNERRSTISLGLFRDSTTGIMDQDEMLQRKRQDLVCSLASVAIYVFAFGLTFYSTGTLFYDLPVYALKIWALVNFGLYGLEFLILVGIRISLKAENITRVRNFENLFNLVTGLFGLFGLFVIYTEKVEEFGIKDYEHSKLVMILKCMAWFRIIYLIIFGFFLVCVTIMVLAVCCATAIQGGDLKQNLKNQVGRRSSIMVA